MVRSLWLVPLLFLASAAARSQMVVWTTSESKVEAAAAAGGLIDMVMAEQERLRTTLMTHRKSGLRPAPGEEVLVRPGEVIVARVAYTATYFARPRADFVNSSGVPIRADGFRAWKMLNNKFCGLSDKKCFDDKNFDGAWDSAGQAGGRWVDVPYEVVEVRRELKDGDREELLLGNADAGGVQYREWISGALLVKKECTPIASGQYACGRLKVREIGKEEDAVRFAIEKG